VRAAPIAPVALALALLMASPARADFDPVRAVARARAQQHKGLVLSGVGAAFGVVLVAGLVVVASASSCGGGEFFDDFFCALARIDTGAIMAGAGAAVAIPLVTAGLTLYKVGGHDLWAEPALNRRTRGRGIAIVGGAIAAAAVVLGGLALWYGYERKPYDQDAWAATTSLAALHGAVGLGLVGGGLALYSAAR